MQGKARVRTIERLKMTEDSKVFYKAMVGKDGRLILVKDTYASYLTGGCSGAEEFNGSLNPFYGGEFDAEHNFGPEFTFEIYIQKHLNEPVLMIKTAWGGKNLLHQFRSPSGRVYALDEKKAAKFKAEGKLEEALAEHKKNTGEYYRLMKAAPAAMEEFKGSVSAVYTGQYWDMKATELQ